MKTALLIAIVCLSTACSGPAFTVAEVQGQAAPPDAVGLPLDALPASLPDAGVGTQPDAGPTSSPDALPAQVDPDAGQVLPDVAAPQPEAATTSPEAAAAQSDAGVDASPPSSPVVLCDSAAQASYFVFSSGAANFVAAVGSNVGKVIDVTDQGVCSAAVIVTTGSWGEFTVGSDCGVLTPGQSCEVNILFSARAPGKATYDDGVSILGQDYTIDMVGLGESQ